ncbi:MAG: NAD(P)/FAD-dependent oxidoreductase [Sporomusaceae bacterium]|nr:NAD(P)/FAD-dependent oxidoreductase [Sporomusaceae bacterium]
MYDVCVIGAGVVGMNIARELSRYTLRICVLEKEADVSCGCSKANSGIVHGGYSDEPGTLKAQLCVKGNRMYEQLERELHFGYRRTGSLVLAFRDEDLPKLEQLYLQGLKNEVGGLSIISGEQARRIEPHLSREVKAALYCENAGVTSPYEFVIALAENAIANGVELRLNTTVTGIQALDSRFVIDTAAAGALEARCVVNAAGIYSDAVSRLAGINDFQITPRRGQYLLLDKDQNYLARTVIFQVPTELGKGILVTPTYHGNLMIGPNAETIADKDDVGTDAETLGLIAAAARQSVPGLDLRKALTSFAGNRPIANRKDFVIEASRIKGFIQLVGIDSPGLTASPAIALKVTELIRKAGLSLVKKAAFQSERPPVISKKPAGFTGSVDAADPRERIICRCEQVTEAEIIDCMRRGIAVGCVDAVKRRTRAGMGRCQGAFCAPRVRQILAGQLGISPETVEGSCKGATLAERAKRGEFFKL